ncbi:MAG: ribosome-associated translation inhibitor RaiA [Candidatus Pacebacteria bacterium]|nr:ribosome-associated translation inhibitor RaiA [Candidatus Paceibacterota bacterium]MBP9852015.1 ribosome-associated translation inhibitor RaiA [Candidatus Paceibacterota bacterium]
MNINFKATSIVLSDAIRDYAEKRIMTVGKLLGENVDNVIIDVELSQTTKHHKAGEIYKTEIMVRNGGRRIRAVSVKEDLYASIDDAKDELEREIVASKERSRTLFRRGAHQVKNILKGISSIPSRLKRNR